MRRAPRVGVEELERECMCREKHEAKMLGQVHAGALKTMGS